MAARRSLALFLSLALVAPLPAHEVETNRLTLVQRDRSHIALTFFIDYPGVLHRLMAPTRPFSQFILMYSAMPAGEFRKAIAAAQARLQSGTHLSLPSGDLAIRGWKWPDAEQAQGMLREVAMAAIVAPEDHAHLQPVEIRAEAVAQTGIATVDVRLPPELQDVLVVSYRPKQTLASPRGRPARITF